MDRRNENDFEQARKKSMRYCAYQERCIQEVITRLEKEDFSRDVISETISFLQDENFLNETRFAELYCSSKFRLKKWGRLKIEIELLKRNINSEDIRHGLKEIDEKDYNRTLFNLLITKAESITETNLYIKRDKVAKFAQTKGFEPDLIWKILKSDKWNKIAGSSIN